MAKRVTNHAANNLNLPATSYGPAGTTALIIATLFCVLLFIAPLAPDVRLTRPKLLVLEMGLYTLLFALAASQLYFNSLKYRKSPVILPLAAYVTVQLVFYALSPDKPVALNELKRCLLSATGFLVAAHALANERWRQWAILAFIAGGFCAAVYGLLQHSGGIAMIAVPQMGRIISTFGNPIFFAAHLIIVIPVAIGLLLTTKSKATRIFLLITLATCFAALYYAQTRAAIIACAAGGLTLAWLLPPPGPKRTRAFAITLVAVATFAWFTKDIWFRQQAHFLIWRDTLAMWTNHPWFGTGPGTFHVYFPSFASKELLAIWPQQQSIINDAHNEYIQYLAETGIVGFGVFIWLLAALLRSAHNSLLNSSGKDRALVGGLLAACISLLVQNIFSVDMRFIVSSVYLLMLFGFIASFNSPLVAVNVPAKARNLLALAVAVLGATAYPAILRPYLAQKNVAATPDFFDERVLQPAKTIADLQTIARQYPGQPSVHERLAWVYAKEQNFDKAIEQYLIANRLNPRLPGPLNNLGNIYFLKNDRASAITYWERSIAADPRQLDSRLNLATAYYYNGQLKPCVEQLKTVLKIDPHNEKAIVFLKRLTE
jgi:O-antigen ligase